MGKHALVLCREKLEIGIPETIIDRHYQSVHQS